MLHIQAQLNNVRDDAPARQRPTETTRTKHNACCP